MRADGRAVVAGVTADEISAYTAEHRHRAEVLREQSESVDDLLAAFAELEVAHEELDVAESEIRAQQEHIDRLLTDRTDDRGWRDRLATSLPVPVLTTDPAGMIRAANHAAALLLRVRQPSMLSKPLFVYVANEDRLRLRAAVRGLVAGGEDLRIDLQLRPRDAPTVSVSVTAVAESATGDGTVDLVRWILMPADSSSNGSGHAVRSGAGIAVASALGALSQLPIQDLSDQEVLAKVVSLARQALEAADGASITLGSPHKPTMVAADNAVAQKVDGLQLLTGEGPCVEAYAVAQTRRSGRLSEDPRWPRFATQAAAVPIESALAVPISGVGSRVGVLNLYAREPDAFDDEHCNIGEVFAVAASTVLQDRQERAAMRRLSEQLNEALASRAVIDQAKGVLMLTHRCSADEAFTRLVKVSQRRNTKVHDVARWIVDGLAGGRR